MRGFTVDKAIFAWYRCQCFYIKNPFTRENTGSIHYEIKHRFQIFKKLGAKFYGLFFEKNGFKET